MPQAASASRVCSPAAFEGGRPRLGSVREKRGAGTGWTMPSCSTKVPRALRCGCSKASVIGMIPATQASVPSKISTHSACVLLVKVSVKTCAHLVVPLRLALARAGVLDAEERDERVEELRLERARRDRCLPSEVS